MNHQIKSYVTFNFYDKTLSNEINLKTRRCLLCETMVIKKHDTAFNQKFDGIRLDEHRYINILVV